MLGSFIKVSMANVISLSIVVSVVNGLPTIVDVDVGVVDDDDDVVVDTISEVAL